MDRARERGRGGEVDSERRSKEVLDDVYDPLRETPCRFGHGLSGGDVGGESQEDEPDSGDEGGELSRAKVKVEVERDMVV